MDPGQSFIFWAQKRAASKSYVANLGVDPAKFDVFWRGCRGMVWEELILEINRMYMVWPPPDVMLIYLGAILTPSMGISFRHL